MMAPELGKQTDGQSGAPSGSWLVCLIARRQLRLLVAASATSGGRVSEDSLTTTKVRPSSVFDKAMVGSLWCQRESNSR